MSYIYKQLTASDVNSLKQLNELFSGAFDDPTSYQSNLPSDVYLENFLKDASHLVLVANSSEGKLVGGLVAYVLEKFEQERKEIYVYDLAVAVTHRHKGVATGLFAGLRTLAKKLGAYVIFVQADKGDEAAVSFYRSLGAKEIDTHNFDIEVS